MAHPPYVLNVKRFDQLCIARGIKTRTEFIQVSGINRRTFYAAIDPQPGALQMNTIAYILDMFPGTQFEYLFIRTKPKAVAALSGKVAA